MEGNHFDFLAIVTCLSMIFVLGFWAGMNIKKPQVDTNEWQCTEYDVRDGTCVTVKKKDVK